MMIYVSTHAVQKHVSRVCGANPESYTDKLEQFVLKDIRDSVSSPDWVKNDREEMPPIHVKGQTAVVVNNEVPDWVFSNGELDNNITLVESEGGREESVYVSTTYNSSTFEDEKNGKQEPRRVRGL